MLWISTTFLFQKPLDDLGLRSVAAASESLHGGVSETGGIRSKQPSDASKSRHSRQQASKDVSRSSYFDCKHDDFVRRPDRYKSFLEIRNRIHEEITKEDSYDHNIATTSHGGPVGEER